MKVLDKVLYKGHKGIIIGIAENGDITITYHYYQINNIVYTSKTVKREQLEVL
jgi:hypothetical protein